MVDDDDDRTHDLALRAAIGDRAAFGELYERYRGDLLAFVRRRVRRHEDAEDIVEQAFYKALVAVGRRDLSVPFNAWLFHLTGNLVTDFYRAQRPAAQSTAPPDSESSAEDRVLEPYLDDRLIDALAALTARQRWVIRLRFFDGLTYGEVAQRLGCIEGAVRAVQMRALHALREALDTEPLEWRASA